MSRSGLCRTLGFALVAFLFGGLHADSVIWKGERKGDVPFSLDNPACWQGERCPTSSDTAVFKHTTDGGNRYSLTPAAARFINDVLTLNYFGGMSILIR